MIIASIPNRKRKIRLRIISDNELIMTVPRNVYPSLNNFKNILWFHKNILLSGEYSAEDIIEEFWPSVYLSDADKAKINEYARKLTDELSQAKV